MTRWCDWRWFLAGFVTMLAFLYLMGVDHTKLTYRYQGRDFRLTDVEGHIVKPILA